MATIGGFCVGSHFIAEHQRLSGLGYIFSASLPPMLTQAAICSLDRFEREPHIFEQLQQKSRQVHSQFEQFSKLKLGGDALSPVKHLYLSEKRDSFEAESKLLTQVADKVPIAFLIFQPLIPCLFFLCSVLNEAWPSCQPPTCRTESVSRYVPVFASPSIAYWRMRTSRPPSRPSSPFPIRYSKSLFPLNFNSIVELIAFSRFRPVKTEHISNIIIFIHNKLVLYLGLRQ